MSKTTLDQMQAQQSKIRSQLNEAEKQEKKLYEALAALINYIKGVKKHELKTAIDFSTFKKDLLATVTKLEIKKHKSNGELKFNVKHYERAIKCASDITYRDMAIQAANKDLNQETMNELVMVLYRDCREASKQVKEWTVELHKLERENKNAGYLFQNVVEAVTPEEETEPARA